MARSKRGTLFEVMNKAPQGQVVRRRPSLFPWRRVQKTVGPIVAEPLTEEEAAAELAARREAELAAIRARQEAAQKREAARQARLEEKRLKQESRRLRRAAQVQQLREYAAVTPDSASDAPWRPPVLLSRGRLLFSLSVSGCAVCLASVCLLLLGAYSLGRHRAGVPGGSNGVTSVAAVNSNLQSPLLVDRPAEKPTLKSPPANPDLSELLKTPAARRETPVAANQPAAVSAVPPTMGEAAVSPDREKLNYLQIESFRITRERSGEQLREDVAAVRAFLAARGVQTVARRLSNGYVLFSEQGFPAGPEHESARAAFRRKIEELGKEYRAAGGAYRFKDTLFVSYGVTQTGQPE